MVVLYSTGCPQCCVLKEKLDAKGIEYTENTSRDEMLALGLTSVPTLCVDGEMMGLSRANEWIKNQ